MEEGLFMLYAGRVEEFKEYSQFKSLKDFNTNIEMILASHKKDFTKGELVAFKRLVRFSAKYAGVAFAKVGTLIKEINKMANGYGISRSTFERMLKKARQLGILTVKNTVKSKGGKGHNVYIFNPIDVLKKEKLTHCEEVANPCESKNEPSKIEEETINLFKTNNLNINHLNVKRSPYIKGVPKSLQHFQSFFGKQVKTLYGRVWLAAKKLGVSVEQDKMQQIGFIAFDQLKKYVKEGKQLTEEQLCKIAYSISYNQLTAGLASGEVIDLNKWYSTEILHYAKKQKAYTQMNLASRKELDELGVF